MTTRRLPHVAVLSAGVTTQEVLVSGDLPFWPRVMIHDVSRRRGCQVFRDQLAPQLAHMMSTPILWEAGGRLRVYVVAGSAEPVLAADVHGEGCEDRTAAVNLSAFGAQDDPFRLRVVREHFVHSGEVSQNGSTYLLRRGRTLSVVPG